MCEYRGWLLAAAGSGYLAAAVNSLDAGLGHEPSHPFAAHTDTFGGQFSPDSGSTKDAPRRLMDAHDPVPQHPISPFPDGRRTVSYTHLTLPTKRIV